MTGISRVKVLRTETPVQVTCQWRRESTPELLAPLWHTRLLMGLLLAVAATGTALGASPIVGSRIAGAYLPLLAVAIGLTVYVTRLGLGQSKLRVLLGETWREPSRVVIDVLSALLFSGTLLCGDAWLSHALSLPESVAGHALLPTTAGETAAWLVVVTLVGACEEIVYRGYLQHQLAALSGRRWVGVLLQALLFGVAHGEQGGPAVARVAAYGLAFGWLAAHRESLVPGIVAHVGIDAYAALAAG